LKAFDVCVALRNTLEKGCSMQIFVNGLLVGALESRRIVSAQRRSLRASTPSAVAAEAEGKKRRTKRRWVLSRLLDLAAERAALSQAGLATGGLAKHGGASTAEHNRGRMREHGGAGEGRATRGAANDRNQQQDSSSGPGKLSGSEKQQRIEEAAGRRGSSNSSSGKEKRGNGWGQEQ
jgi:hypothetical protein